MRSLLFFASIALWASSLQAQPQLVGSFNIACCPQDIHHNIHNQVYVVESNGALRKYDKSGNLLFQIIVPTSGNVSGVDVANNGSMIMVNRYAHEVYEYSNTGQLLRTIASRGSGHGQFNGPERVARDADGNIYITEWSNDRIQKLSPDWQYMAKWSWNGRGATEGLDIGPDNHVYVVLRGDNVIWKMTLDLQFVLSWEGVDRPWGVLADQSGRVHVVDINGGVDTYTNTGQHLYRWGDGILSGPREITQTPDGDIFVMSNHKVWQWRYATVSVEETPWTLVKQLYR